MVLAVIVALLAGWLVLDISSKASTASTVVPDATTTTQGTAAYEGATATAGESTPITAVVQIKKPIVASVEVK